MTRLALLALLGACGSSSTLEGSLSEQASLEFDDVALVRSDSALALAFTKNPIGGGGSDIVFKLTAATKDLDLAGALVIDLAERIDASPRGAASRAVGSDSRRDFPPIVRGTLRLDAGPAIGTPVRGRFDVLFDQGGAIGSGRTAFGDFEAIVAEAGR